MENRASAFMETLTSRGWCFKDVEEIKSLIQIHIITLADQASVTSIESQLLLNMDLRSIGGKSLPTDPNKSSFLPGPKILQIVSVRDIYQSSIEASSRSSGSRRLLRLGLTDGHSEIVGIEYSSIPSIADDIVPGTKVRLENKAAIHSGILCLNPKAITVLGGVVQSLYEEWQMNRKYSSLSNTSLRLTHRNDGVGPPPFEKLQIDASSRISIQNNSSYPLASSSKNCVPHSVKPGGDAKSREMGTSKGFKLEADKIDVDKEAASSSGKVEEKRSSSETRPKEVSEAVPVQNQAAAQKLLQKMNQPSRGGRHGRGPRFRGRGDEDEKAVFTLEEWEKRKGEVKAGGVQDVSHDEMIARQLQQQLNFEDSQARMVHESEAERIRTSMFNFQRAEQDSYGGRSGFRGRGRGRR